MPNDVDRSAASTMEYPARRSRGHPFAQAASREHADYNDRVSGALTTDVLAAL
jgi:hypothetical protein